MSQIPFSPFEIHQTSEHLAKSFCAHPLQNHNPWKPIVSTWVPPTPPTTEAQPWARVPPVLDPKTTAYLRRPTDLETSFEISERNPDIWGPELLGSSGFRATAAFWHPIQVMNILGNLEQYVGPGWEMIFVTQVDYCSELHASNSRSVNNGLYMRAFKLKEKNNINTKFLQKIINVCLIKCVYNQDCVWANFKEKVSRYEEGGGVEGGCYFHI